MSLSRKHLTAALLGLSLACIDHRVGPSGDSGALQITPLLPASSSMATFNIVIDSVYVEIYVYDTTGCEQCEAATALPGGAANSAVAGRLDTMLVSETFFWDPAAETLPLSFELPDLPAGHLFQLYLEMRAGGSTMFYGYQELGAVRGRVTLPPIDVYYIGPGYLADSVAITQVDTLAQAIDTLYFDATAFQGGIPLDTAYVGWRTTDTTKARISYTGRLTFLPAIAGGQVGVIALLPNGISDTVIVSVPAAATAIERTSGHDQTAPAQTIVPDPLRVRVLRSGGLPNPGVLVRFQPLGATGTAVIDSLVLTDSLGYAQTYALAGSIVGGMDVEAFVVASSSVKVTFRVTVAPALSAPIIYVADSFGITGALRKVQPNGSGRGTMLSLAPYNEFALPRWAPDRTRAAYSADNGNFTGLWITNAAGDTSANYVADQGAFRPRFSPNGSHIAFQCDGNKDNDFSGAVCVGGGVTGEIGGLTGAGNAGSRVLLTDKVPTRSSGPASFAWDRTVAGRIAFVRDSTADTTGYVQSAIYRIDQTGTGVALLSAPVMDLGDGPLKVVGPMDWSPDGTRIVFAATVPGVSESNLYLLNVANGVVTQLTTAPSGSFGENGDRVPVFSPTGAEVLFLRVDHSGDGMGADFHVVRVSTKSVRQVGYEGSNWNSSDPYSLAGDWSPDGQRLLLSGMVSFEQSLYIVPASVSSNAEYTAQRVLIGQADGSSGLVERTGSWRP